MAGPQRPWRTAEVCLERRPAPGPGRPARRRRVPVGPELADRRRPGRLPDRRGVPLVLRRSCRRTARGAGARRARRAPPGRARGPAAGCPPSRGPAPRCPPTRAITSPSTDRRTAGTGTPAACAASWNAAPSSSSERVGRVDAADLLDRPGPLIRVQPPDGSHAPARDRPVGEPAVRAEAERRPGARGHDRGRARAPSWRDAPHRAGLEPRHPGPPAPAGPRAAGCRRRRPPGRRAPGAGARLAVPRALEPPRGLRPVRARPRLRRARDRQGDADAGHAPRRRCRRLPGVPRGDADHPDGRAALRRPLPLGRADGRRRTTRSSRRSSPTPTGRAPTPRWTRGSTSGSAIIPSPASGGRSASAAPFVHAPTGGPWSFGPRPTYVAAPPRAASGRRAGVAPAPRPALPRGVRAGVGRGPRPVRDALPAAGQGGLRGAGGRAGHATRARTGSRCSTSRVASSRTRTRRRRPGCWRCGTASCSPTRTAPG